MDSKTKHDIGNKLQVIVATLADEFMDKDRAINCALEIGELVRSSDTKHEGMSSESKKVRLGEFNRLIPLLECVNVCGKPLEVGKFVCDNALDAAGLLTISEVDGTQTRIQVFYGREIE